MPAPSITDEGMLVTNFIALDGLPDAMSERLEVITRAAEDGVSFRKIGKRGRQFVLDALVDLPSGKTIEQKVIDLKALCGQLCEIVSNTGDSYVNVMILDVQPMLGADIVGSVGGVEGASGVRLLSARITCHVTTVPS